MARGKPQRKAENVLNLDEVFGQSQPIFVKWEGVKHQLISPRDLGAKQIVEWERLTEEIKGKPAGEDELPDMNPDELEDAVSRAIFVIGPTLPIDSMPFLAKLRTLEWYIGQVTPEELKEDPKAIPQSTGDS